MEAFNNFPKTIFIKISSYKEISIFPKEYFYHTFLPHNLQYNKVEFRMG